MRAMILEHPGEPLREVELPVPEPASGQVRVRVAACGVCRTDLHVIDGDLEEPKLPVIPGHEIVGYVDALSPGATRLRLGERVGIPWLGHTCGVCPYCRRGQENLCDAPGFTGYQIDGGYADYTVADANYCFPLPGDLPDAEIAPWLCAGLIGHRSLRLAGDAQRLGIYGFGAAAHLVVQVARHEGRQVYAFTREGDAEAQKLPSRSAARGRGVQARGLPSRSTQSSSLRRSAAWCLRRCGSRARAVPLCSAAFT